MRITVGDPDAYRAQVFLNGAPIKMCVMADEECGEVLRYMTDRNGNIIGLPQTGEGLGETVRGSVAVFIPACYPEDGFNAWMRERTEAAHQAMMKHTRRGGIDYEAKKGALRSAIPGASVTLNSGGPAMTVIGMTYDGKAVACTWEADGLAMGDSFPIECLVHCEVPQRE